MLHQLDIRHTVHVGSLSFPKVNLTQHYFSEKLIEREVLTIIINIAHDSSFKSDMLQTNMF